MPKLNQRKKKTKVEWNQEIVSDYIEAGEPWPADRRTIAAWAVANKRWEPQRRDVIGMCAKELAEAMRCELEVDPQGRTVRAKYCALISEMDEKGNLIQKTVWFGRDAEPDLIRRSFQQRRNSILGDCKQLKTDRDSYNENNRWGVSIQMTFNFESDLADLEHDTDYNPPKPPEDED